MKEVSVLVGAGSIGLAIARRVGVGKITVLADYSLENAQRAAKTMEDAGFDPFAPANQTDSLQGSRMLGQHLTQGDRNFSVL